MVSPSNLERATSVIALREPQDEGQSFALCDKPNWEPSAICTHTQ